MTKYDNTDEKDKIQLILRDHWQSNCRYSSKSDISLKTEKCLDLLTEKGVYPYDYTNAFENFIRNNYHPKNNFTADWVKKI